MKIAIISDIHANAAALNAFPETYDELWVTGDLVNFGPYPAEVVDWVRKHAHCVIRGNHDHAVGYDADPRCIPPYQPMAAETGRYSASVLTEEQKGYLRLLPLTLDRTIAGTRFHLCHATPSDPLFGYLEESAWTTEVISIHAEVLVVGHTHEPVLRQLGHIRMVNSGSLAGLRVTSPQASYATWEDGELHLKKVLLPIRRDDLCDRSHADLAGSSTATQQTHHHRRPDGRRSVSMSEIKSLEALEILDSRGNPTLAVTVTLNDGTRGTAKIPSGVSTGLREAVELRDGDKTRYGGKGVLRACAFVEGEIQEAVRGLDANDQAGLDERLCSLDGTPTKARLGANAVLGVSLATAQAAALARGVPLYAHLNHGSDFLLPTPMLNVLNGGRHADNSVDFQEFMISPVGAPSFRDGLRSAVETFHVLKSNLQLKTYSTAVGDEGGFAPELESNDEAVELILEAIQKAGYRPGKDIVVMLDPAASEFYEDGVYVFRKSDQSRRTPAEMIALWKEWLKSYPEIWSLEDGIGEEDRDGWQQLTKQLGDTIQLVGDDNFVTNPRLFRQGIRDGIANAILIKLNQIGTVSETLECISIAKENGYGAVISHRSGETDDTSIADLAVATGVGQIKTGSASRGERIAKYNRLLMIERELGAKARYAGATPYARWKDLRKSDAVLVK